VNLRPFFAAGKRAAMRASIAPTRHQSAQKLAAVSGDIACPCAWSVSSPGGGSSSKTNALADARSRMRAADEGGGTS
jgi:hypothetical protein